jgi:hypothetical protein
MEPFRPRDDEAEGVRAMWTQFDADGFLIPDPQPTGRGVPDPRATQRAPGTLRIGKNFAPRPELISRGCRGGPEVRIGPGSEQWVRGQDDELNKVSYTTRDVMGSRRRPG